MSSWTGGTSTTRQAQLWHTTGWQPTASDAVAVLQGYADVLGQYRLHPEAKLLAPDGQPCGRATRGVLSRRPIDAAGTPALIGKEANRLDDVQSGLVADLDEVLTTYVDPAEDGGVLADLILPVLARYSGRELARLVGCDHRTVDRIRRGQHPRNDLVARLVDCAAATAAADLNVAASGVQPDSTVAPWNICESLRHGRRNNGVPWRKELPGRNTVNVAGGDQARRRWADVALRRPGVPSARRLPNPAPPAPRTTRASQRESPHPAPTMRPDRA